MLYKYLNIVFENCWLKLFLIVGYLSTSLVLSKDDTEKVAIANIIKNIEITKTKDKRLTIKLCRDLRGEKQCVNYRWCWLLCVYRDWWPLWYAMHNQTWGKYIYPELESRENNKCFMYLKGFWIFWGFW